MKYGIASYHRPECKTVNSLLEEGVRPYDIIISTQTKDDYEEYKSRYELLGIKVLYREANNSASNRNTILMEYKERPILLLDDDITSFAIGTKHENMIKRETGVAIKLIESLSQLNYDLIGCAETTSNVIKRHREPISTNCLLQGSFILFNTSDILFNEQYKMLVDYELSCRAIQNGFKVARYNYLGTNKPKNGTNKGGYHECYVSGENRKWLWKLQNEYSFFKVNKDYTGGKLVWRRKKSK